MFLAPKLLLSSKPSRLGKSGYSQATLMAGNSSAQSAITGKWSIRKRLHPILVSRKRTIKSTSVCLTLLARLEWRKLTKINLCLRHQNAKIFLLIKSQVKRRFFLQIWFLTWWSCHPWKWSKMLSLERKFKGRRGTSFSTLFVTTCRCLKKITKI